MALLKLPYDRDYGPWRGTPGDPRTESPEWDDLTCEQKVEELQGESRDALLDLIEKMQPDCQLNLDDFSKGDLVKLIMEWQ